MPESPGPCTYDYLNKALLTGRIEIIQHYVREPQGVILLEWGPRALDGGQLPGAGNDTFHRHGARRAGRHFPVPDRPVISRL
jgi:hypothetical protein